MITSAQAMQAPSNWTDKVLFARSLHRLVFNRLVGMTVAACLLGMLGLHYVERARFMDMLRDEVLEATEQFQELALQELSSPGLGDHKRLQAILENANFGSRQHLGATALLLVKDIRGNVAARRVDAEPSFARRLAAYVDTNGYAVDRQEETPRYELAAIASRPVLHILAPLKGAGGRVVAYGECLFVVSAKVVREAKEKMAMTLALAVGLVVATSALLYPVLLRLVRRMYTASLDLVEANVEMLSVLGHASAKRDSGVGEHSYRVTIYAVRLAQQLRLDRQTMRALIKGAFLHDVGKIAIPDALLLKPDRLTPEEFAEMRRHVQHGRDIVSGVPLLDDAIEVIGGHHEHFDGTGYDQGLKGQDIPLVARIFAIVDVFDALTTERPYKPALPLEEVIRTLERGSGSHFDPQILQIFLRMARDVHQQHASQTSQELDGWLRTNCAKYFTPNMEEWLAAIGPRN
ncbi:HD-GYP domain-containing protein [Humidesulfovibrio sp.]